MNRLLIRFSIRLKVLSLPLLLWAALRADAGLPLWLLPALFGILSGLCGLMLAHLCSSKGRALRRRLFADPPAAVAPEEPPAPLSVLPRAG